MDRPLIDQRLFDFLGRSKGPALTGSKESCCKREQLNSFEVLHSLFY